MSSTLNIGDTVGRLTIVGMYREKGTSRKYLHVTCSCGRKKAVRYSSIIDGDTRSCGCLAKELAAARVTTHNLSNHRLYSVWRGMVSRCTVVTQADFKHYGGRGIKVCDRWATSVEAFIEDMGDSFVEGLEIDRIDNDGNYCLDNCRWATRRQQVLNRRQMGTAFDTHYLTWGGETMCISEWADVTGINRATIGDRVTKLGWSTEKALTTPVRIRSSYLVIGGNKVALKELLYNKTNLHTRCASKKLSVHRALATVLHNEVHIYANKCWDVAEPYKDTNSVEACRSVVSTMKLCGGYRLIFTKEVPEIVYE